MPNSKRPKSRFQQKLDADPELRKRADAIREQVREAARPEIEASKRSERLTAKDFAVTINARAYGQ